MRKGTRSRVAGQAHPDGHTDMKADPGMVLNYKAQEEAPPQPAAAQPDLLDFDGLSMDAPPAAAQASPHVPMCTTANWLCIKIQRLHFAAGVAIFISDLSSLFHKRMIPTASLLVKFMAGTGH